MSAWIWDSSLSVGIDVIDNQHRRIVEYINELDAAIAQKDRDSISLVLSELVDYTMTHFAFEESIMIDGGYPFADAHKKVHEAFASQVRQFQARFSQGQDISKRLRAELQIWLFNHIKRDDKDYAPYVKKVQKKGWIGGLVHRFFG